MGLADIAIASFFRNADYAGFTIDADRWPRTARFVGDVLAHAVLAKLLAYEDIQRSAAISGRRRALLEAGAPLTEDTLGTREPRRGTMRL
jgi:hypothetical protein